MRVRAHAGRRGLNRTKRSGLWERQITQTSEETKKLTPPSNLGGCYLGHVSPQFVGSLCAKVVVQSANDQYPAVLQPGRCMKKMTRDHGTDARPCPSLRTINLYSLINGW